VLVLVAICFVPVNFGDTLNDHNDAQLIVLVPADNNVCALWQGSKFIWDALPGLSTHDHCVHAAFWSIGGNTTEIRYFF
jgi:hypothetical protein